MTNSMPPTQREILRQIFTNVFQNPSSPDSRKILNFVDLRLRQYKKYNLEAFDILLEAYVRIYQNLDLSKNNLPVNNWFAYIKSYCNNIIREKVRAKTQQKDIIDKVQKHHHDNLYSSPHLERIIQEESQEQVKFLIEQVLENLSEEERNLLILKDVKDMSWREIVQTLKTTEIVSKAEINKYKKQYSRLKKRLRENLEQSLLQVSPNKRICSSSCYK